MECLKSMSRTADFAGPRGRHRPACKRCFAISDLGKTRWGVAVFVRSAHERFAVLHLGVEPALERNPGG